MATAGPSAPLGILLLSGLVFATVLSANAASDADVLLKFKAAISDPAGALRTWTPDTAPCTPKADDSSWAGVICDNGTVLGLQLEDMRLSGTLDLGLLAGLAGLRTLSFMNNSFRGAMPDVKRLGGLRSIYLSMNELSGPIAGNAFDGMGSLKKVHLSRNGFSGPIPASLAAAPKLLELKLDGNRFEGAIPDLRQKDLQVVNVSGNSLEGPIPAALAKMDADLFAGNKGLCGVPLGVPCASSSVSSPSSTSKNSSSSAMAVSLAIALVATVGIVGLAFVALRRQPSRVQEEQLGRLPSSKNSSAKKVRTTSYKEDKLEEGPAADDHQSESGRGSGSGRKAATAAHEQGRLVFVKADMERFELHDLLKSSAEVLGAGKLGCSYKATLTSGASMVVKRFRDMNRVGKEDFEEHMRRLGRLAHPNLLSLVAYYYRKEEKLLVTRYVPNRSVAHLLHGDRKPNNATLDWPARLKIIKGVGRALIYLYDELSMLSVPHGHLKSANVLLGDSFEPLLTDYALVPVMNQSHAAHAMEAYRSPERKQFGRTSKKSDVWSFGLLILELLTGKNPSEQGKEDLLSWADSVAKEEPASGAAAPDKVEVVFDKMRNADEGEMMKLLKIGLSCCESNVDKRWELKDAVDKIEELTAEEGVDDRRRSSSSSEGADASRDDGFSSVVIN